MTTITPNYIEMKATDLKASKAFYENALDFAFTDYGPEYAAVEGGPVQIGLAAGEEPTAPMPAFETDDLESALSPRDRSGVRQLCRRYSPIPVVGALNARTPPATASPSSSRTDRRGESTAITIHLFTLSRVPIQLAVSWIMPERAHQRSGGFHAFQFLPRSSPHRWSLPRRFRRRIWHRNPNGPNAWQTPNSGADGRDAGRFHDRPSGYSYWSICRSRAKGHSRGTGGQGGSQRIPVPCGS